MFISEMMMITHNKMLMSDESWFTVQLVLDLAIIVLLICYFLPAADKDNPAHGTG